MSSVNSQAMMLHKRIIDNMMNNKKQPEAKATEPEPSYAMKSMAEFNMEQQNREARLKNDLLEREVMKPLDQVSLADVVTGRSKRSAASSETAQPGQPGQNIFDGKSLSSMYTKLIDGGMAADEAMDNIAKFIKTTGDPSGNRGLTYGGKPFHPGVMASDKDILEGKYDGTGVAVAEATKTKPKQTFLLNQHDPREMWEYDPSQQPKPATTPAPENTAAASPAPQRQGRSPVVFPDDASPASYFGWAGPPQPDKTKKPKDINDLFDMWQALNAAGFLNPKQG